MQPVIKDGAAVLVHVVTQHVANRQGFIVVTKGLKGTLLFLIVTIFKYVTDAGL